MASVLSRERIRDEIEARKDQIAQLKEAIEFHYEQYERRPEDGFGARDLESKVSELQGEISDLRSQLH